VNPYQYQTIFIIWYLQITPVIVDGKIHACICQPHLKQINAWYDAVSLAALNLITTLQV